MEERISVVVPVYKVEEYLDECVRSITQQTHTDLEIILVDDGSPDHCPSMCDAWKEKDPRIRVIHKKNGGLSDARNAGIDIATGEYIAFVDSDDWILPDMYEEMLKALKHEDADFCSCCVLSCYTSDRQTAWGFREYTAGGPEMILSMLYNDTAFPVCAWNKLYKKECWKTMRFPVGKICEDAFTTYLQVDQAKKIVHLPKAYYCYRIRPQSIMTSSFTVKRMDEEEAWRKNYEYMEEHYPSVYRSSFDFYLQKVNKLIREIPQTKKQEYSKEYDYLRNILKRNRYYILFQSRLGWKHRLKLLLDIQKL